MGDFECQVCGDTFSVPKAALDKYPGWTPKYCRQHSPNNKKKTARSSAKGGARASSGRKSGRPLSASREENLTRSQVLEKYTAGPSAGVFTDGSSHPNPGPGGWGMVWVEDGEIVEEAHGHDPDTTNNRMELAALIAAYEALPEDAEVVIYSDSRLCVDTITKWAPGWERKGWKRKGNPLKNLDLVKPLLKLHRAHPGCKLEWIEAHVGYRWNEYADSLANTWRRSKG
jgi:ribonuclease HI